MRSVTDDLSFFDNEYPVRILYSTYTLRNDYSYSARKFSGKLLTEFCIGLKIKCRKAVIENINIRFSDKRAGYRKSLLLAARYV